MERDAVLVNILVTNTRVNTFHQQDNGKCSLEGIFICVDCMVTFSRAKTIYGNNHILCNSSLLCMWNINIDFFASDQLVKSVTNFKTTHLVSPETDWSDSSVCAIHRF